MPISVDKMDGANVRLLLDERFDFGVVDEFRRCYGDLKEINNKTLVIDFAHTRYMDSSALGMLINARSYFSDSNVKIKIINTNDQVRKIFSISRFDTKFDIS